MITTVDVGGTKTLIAQFGEDFKPKNEIRFETPKDTNAFLQLLQKNLSDIAGNNAISIGVPGIVSDGIVVRCANLPWSNFRLRDILNQQLGVPVFVQNDAKLAGLAEINALNPIPQLGLYVTLGTGIGTAIIIDGRLNPALNPSEGGHSTIWDGDQWKIWENVASGRALSAHFGKYVREITDQSEWRLVAEKVALGLYSLIPIFQPQVIVFGGGVGAYFDNFREPLYDILSQRISSYINVPELRSAQHSEEAVLYGGYYFAKHQESSGIY